LFFVPSLYPRKKFAKPNRSWKPHISKQEIFLKRIQESRAESRKRKNKKKRIWKEGFNGKYNLDFGWMSERRRERERKREREETVAKEK